MKEKFIKSTFILLIGGLITKILGMVIKIIMSRQLGTVGLGVYMLILPTFSLLISLSQFGFPIAISKLVSEDTKNNKRLFFSIIPIIIVINFILIIIIIGLAPFISTNLLHNKSTYLSIIAMALVIPFTSISSVCRSYFFGKEKMFPHVISNIVEDITRLIIILIGTPYFLKFGLTYAICFIVLSNVISEIASTIILLIFLPKNLKITKKDLIPSPTYIKDSLRISIPNTTGRLIGSIGYFFEPIIITNILLQVGYTNTYITHQYGIISGYVIPILLLPSFFTLAISQALLPLVSREYVKGNKRYVSNKIKLTVAFTLFVGFFITIFFTIKPTFFLKLIYNTTEGATYMRILAPICLLQYIQSPLSFSLDAMGKSKDNFIASIISVTSRTISLIIFSYFKIGLWSLVISISLNIVLTTAYTLKRVKYHLR